MALPSALLTAVALISWGYSGPEHLDSAFSGGQSSLPSKIALTGKARIFSKSREGHVGVGTGASGE